MVNGLGKYINNVKGRWADGSGVSLCKCLELFKIDVLYTSHSLSLSVVAKTFIPLLDLKYPIAIGYSDMDSMSLSLSLSLSLK